MRTILIGLIVLYQVTFSPDHGPLRFVTPTRACRFMPTCSDYAIDALNTHGTLRALPKILSRLLRCHPRSKGGYDPVL
ncbi:MAG: hypothetical protein UY95_C0020G0004 [Parcubacteria group bacterium GW2011_GWA2_56_7]|nr:MAG: hypothetical protein UY95_C0020G0004 [Parcubacteria group bacterium GW2011_GWA2_56_7]